MLLQYLFCILCFQLLKEEIKSNGVTSENCFLFDKFPAGHGKGLCGLSQKSIGPQGVGLCIL